VRRQQRYEQHQEERLYERKKAALAAAAALEAVKEAEELRRMVLEEQRSWDAYELNTRNHIRMIEQARAPCVYRMLLLLEFTTVGRFIPFRNAAV